MPYVRKDLRAAVDMYLNRFLDSMDHIITNGELTYIIIRLLLDQEPDCYNEYAELMGVLECTKQEYYRRVIVPYERKKKEENGDVF